MNCRYYDEIPEQTMFTCVDDADYSVYVKDDGRLSVRRGAGEYCFAHAWETITFIKKKLQRRSSFLENRR